MTHIVSTVFECFDEDGDRGLMVDYHDEDADFAMFTINEGEWFSVYLTDEQALALAKFIKKRVNKWQSKKLK